MILTLRNTSIASAVQRGHLSNTTAPDLASFPLSNGRAEGDYLVAQTSGGVNYTALALAPTILTRFARS